MTPHRDDGKPAGETQPARQAGETQVALVNAAADRGVALRYTAATLPCFTLWKNTDTEREGYVTGLEPGTGFAYTRATERAAGRVPTLAPGEHVSFGLTWRILHGASEVVAAKAEIDAIQAGRTPVMLTSLGSTKAVNK